MSVFIKGMDMPVDCRDCRLMDFDTDSGKTWCSPADAILAEDWNPIPFNGRPDWCPLVEVKTPHGDLIDRDNAYNVMLNEMCGTGFQGKASYVLKSELYTPTVIEAEGTEE